MQRYRSTVYDSFRWEGFALRPGDIVLSTPPKCGTTWMQMILALLIFQEPVLTQPLSVLSPWLDMQGRARRDVVTALAAQTHRRFIKTHTPLDGLPNDPSVTYVCVGRDPRDVAMSIDNHRDNLNVPVFLQQRAEAAALDGVELDPPILPAPRHDDPIERFWAWVDDDTPPTEIASSLLRTLRHIEAFLHASTGLDVAMVHYDDLQTDLEGQMRRLAARLDIAVPESAWPALVGAAGFEQMRARADMTAPNATQGYWRDNDRFFHRGRSGQWQELLDETDLIRYRARACSIGPLDVVAWAQHGRS